MKVGIAKTDITPDPPAWMSGYIARTEPADGVYHNIEASAVVFDSGQTRVGILAADLVGVDEFLLEPVREAAAELGIAPERMLINCSHTHCGPACRVVRGSYRKYDETYLEELKAKLAGVVEEAVGDLREAQLDYTVGSCTLGICNRRIPDGGTVASMLPNPDGRIDTDVPVMRVLTPDGAVRAVLFSYACHPTTMGGQQIGPDFPGPARDFVAEKIQGCLPIFLQGCGGDAKPRNITADRTFANGPLEMVYEIGRELGRAVLAALCGKLHPLGEELFGTSDIAQLPTVGNPTEEELAVLEKSEIWWKKWAEAARKTIAEKGSLANFLPVEVQVLNMGGLYIVGMGGEINAGIGLELKEKLPDIRIWPLDYSNLLRCYVASRGQHAEGGGEVKGYFMVSWTPEPRPAGLKPESVDVIINKAIELARSSQRRGNGY